MASILDFQRTWDGTGGVTGSRVTAGGRFMPDDAMPEIGTLQVLLGEGQMEGLVDGLKSVYLDNTPIQNSDGSFNFRGVALALVAGTNTQPAVKGVTGTESETSVNVQVVQATPVVRSVTSGASAVRVKIAIPSLKVVDNTTGNAVGNSVTIKIERQNASWNGGAWQAVSLFGGGLITGGPYDTKLTKGFRIDLPASGTWQIRVTRLSDDDADAYHLSQTWWESLTEIVDARLRYPNSSILSLRVNAKQFQSIPQVSVLMKGTRLQVPTNYDPATRVYATTGPGTTGGVWDGTFKTAWSDNPAWAFYTMAVNTRWGAGSFLQSSGLDKCGLYTIAQWCDTLVPDGKGGTEPRMTCNMYLQGAQNAIKALGQMASIFWGVIYYASGLVVPVADSDTTPVAFFTNANVEDGRFVYAGTAKSARHTAALASFLNPETGYAKDAALYEDEAGIARYGYNLLDLQAIACTSHGQALRLAKWAVLSELMAPETVSFTSGLEGSTVAPGEVVQVADQFRAGNTRSGGRIMSATTTTVQLDAPVTLAAGTYTLRVQTDTGMESRTVTTGAGTTALLTVSPAFSMAPDVGYSWLLQAGSTASLWRVLSIRRGEGLRHEITALRHDPAKYAALGLTSGDVVVRPTMTRTAPAPAGLSVTSINRILDDRQQVTLTANWTPSAAAGYVAEASRDYGPWQAMAVSGSSASLDAIQPGAWRVRVAGDWRGAGLSPWATATTTVNASATVPPWVAAATAQALKALVQAPEIGTWATFGALPAAGSGSTGSYPVGCYIYSAVIVDTAGDNTAGTLYKNVAGTWTRQAGSLVAGKIIAAQLAAQLAITGTIQSNNYSAGTSTTPATGFWLSGTAATKTAIGGSTHSVQFELGTAALMGGYLVSGITGKVMSTLGSNELTSTSYRAWYRGNNSGPVPIITGITVTPRKWTTPNGRFDILIQPTTYTDNLDGLRRIVVELFSQSSAGTTGTLTSLGTYKITTHDRSYANSTENHADNAIEETIVTNDGFGGTTVPAMKITLYGVRGHSETRCYYSPAGWAVGTALTDNGTSWPAGLTGASGGGAGGGDAGGDERPLPEYFT